MYHVLYSSWPPLKWINMEEGAHIFKMIPCSIIIVRLKKNYPKRNRFILTVSTAFHVSMLKESIWKSITSHFYLLWHEMPPSIHKPVAEINQPLIYFVRFCWPSLIGKRQPCGKAVLKMAIQYAERIETFNLNWGAKQQQPRKRQWGFPSSTSPPPPPHSFCISKLACTN